jgi:hypothetical protein
VVIPGVVVVFGMNAAFVGVRLAVSVSEYRVAADAADAANKGANAARAIFLKLLRFISFLLPI